MMSVNSVHDHLQLNGSVSPMISNPDIRMYVTNADPQLILCT